MKSYQVFISNPAENDLFEIGHYITMELLEPKTAQNLLEKISAAILELEQFPLRGALIADDNLANQGIRRLLVDNYIVFYVVSKDRKTVTVIRILYNKRNWKNLL